MPGFFDDPARELVVVLGLLALVWVRSVRVPSWAAPVVGVLAGASLYVYLVHWQVYPHLEDEIPWLATLLSLAAGVWLWQVVERVTAVVVALARGLVGRLRLGRHPRGGAAQA